MSYSTGMMSKRVAVLSRMAARDGEFGRSSSGLAYIVSQVVWASVDFVRGLKALREGSMDAYDTVMFRLRWNPSVTRESLLWHGGHVYEIQQLNAERQRNQLQITAQERPDLEKGVRLYLRLMSSERWPLSGVGDVALYAEIKEINI